MKFAFIIDHGIKNYVEGAVRQFQRLGATIDVIHRASRYGSLAGYDEVIIWNGERPYYTPIIEECEKLNIPHCYLESGYFPQMENLVLSKKGSVGPNIISSDTFIQEADSRVLEDYWTWYGNGRVYKPQNYILVLLQLEQDPATSKYSPIKTMQGLVNWADEYYPNVKKVIRKHPLDTKRHIRTKSQIVDSGSLWDTLLHCKLAIAINSTTLYEGVLAGVPVLPVGECPLQKHDHRDVVHELIQRQIPCLTYCSDLKERIARSLARDLGSHTPIYIGGSEGSYVR